MQTRVSVSDYSGTLADHRVALGISIFEQERGGRVLARAEVVQPGSSLLVVSLRILSRPSRVSFISQLGSCFAAPLTCYRLGWSFEFSHGRCRRVHAGWWWWAGAWIS